MELQPLATVASAGIGAIATISSAFLSKHYITLRFAGKRIKKRYMKSSDYVPDLTRQLLKEDVVKQPLLISAGVADSCVGLLKRIYNESNEAPRISRIHLKRISADLAEHLMLKGLLESTFISSLEGRIKVLQEDRNIQREQVDVIVSEWEGLPPFQGYLFNGQGFTSHWQVNGEGQLDARTPLEWYTKDTAPDRYKREVKAFGVVV